MTKQSVRIGEVVLDQEPRISLYAESPLPISERGVEVLKEKLANLLDKRFQPADLPHRTLTIGEVIETWHCYRATVLRLIRQGKLHPIEVNSELQFDRLEVLSLARDVPERP